MNSRGKSVIDPFRGPSRAPEMRRHEEGTFPVLVVDPNHNQIEITLPTKKDPLVSDLKQAISAVGLTHLSFSLYILTNFRINKQIGLRPNEQQLYFHLKGLVDTKKLDEYGIQPRDIIKIDRALLGGGFCSEPYFCWLCNLCCSVGVFKAEEAAGAAGIPV